MKRSTYFILTDTQFYEWYKEIIIQYTIREYAFLDI